MEPHKEKNQRYVLSIIDRINANKSMPKENKEAALVWYNFMKAKGSAAATIAKHLFCFEKFMEYMPKGVELSKATSEDLQAAVSRIRDTDYAAETKNNIRVVIKAFYNELVSGAILEKTLPSLLLSNQPTFFGRTLRLGHFER
ncbi:MAG: hypothetical protein QXF82_10455 [Nitrososphaeria archaeon]